MAKEFLVRHRNGKESVISEKVAQNLGRQVDVIGEIKGSFRVKGKEKLTPAEFRAKHIHVGKNSDGQQMRKVDKGYKIEHEVDKDSLPGRGRAPGTASRDSVFLVGGKEISRKQWEQSR